VLLPSSLLARRRDNIEVIGAALVAYAAGHGHRSIAAQLGVPASTVRNWLRAFRRQSDELRVAGIRWYHHLDANAAAVAPCGSPAADAVDALGRAARAAVERFGPFDHPWAIINMLTSGRLLGPPHRPVASP
jgi:hypothetical protein